MKTQSFFFGFFATMLFCVSTFLVCCKDDMNDSVRYFGQVVYKNTTTPFPDLTVKVTDGVNIHCQGFTNEDGMFSLKVKVNEIDGNYYLLIGDSTCVPKRVTLSGYGRSEVDLGVVEVEGPSIPSIVLEPLTDLQATSVKCKAVIENDGRATVVERGFVWGEQQYPDISGKSLKCGVGTGTFEATIEGLKQETAYYFRAYAINRLGIAYSDQQVAFTVSGLASVTTYAVSNIQGDHAVGGGEVTNDFGIPVIARGVCWSTSQYPTIEGSKTVDGSGLGAFTSYLTGLEGDMTYFVRAYATNEKGTAYGEQLSFVTTSGIPVVQTANVSNVSASSAVCGGTVTDDGGFAVTARGVCWSTNQYPTINDYKTTDGSGTGTYVSNIHSLQSGVTYYVRAYAMNQKGTAYGEQVSFNSSSMEPSVSIGTISNITASQATATGTITSNGGMPIQACGFCWSSTSSIPTIYDSHSSEATTSNSFTSYISGLTVNTTYYIRAYATNSNGTGYSSVKTFTTSSGMPTVTTGAVSDITATDAVGTGTVTNISNDYPVLSCGLCWSTSSTPNLNDNHTTTTPNNNGSFTGLMTGLQPKTKYYVRAYATTSLGTVYGSARNFTTSQGLPSVSTSSVQLDYFDSSKAIAGGIINSVGGSPITSAGVCWSSSNRNPTINDNKQTVSNTTPGTFSCTVTGLAPGTTYYFRAFAVNSYGVAYGSVQSVTTLFDF